MKRLFSLLVLVTSILQAQHTIQGKITPQNENTWVALYFIESGNQKFITHTDVKKEDKQDSKVGVFELKLPKNSKIGSYRITYAKGFVDFVFNNEDVEMEFNPRYPEQSIIFGKSLENKTYQEYLDAQELVQTKIDSLQMDYFKNPTEELKENFKKEVAKLIDIQNIYEKKTEEMYVNTFIKASKIDNPKQPLDDQNVYRNDVIKTFFDNVDFNNQTLINSPFLINKVSDYVFFLNTADTQSLQQKLYKKSIKNVIDKANTTDLKKIFSQYLISVFTDRKNSEIVDWLFMNYYDKLPRSHRSEDFRRKKLESLKVSVGRFAPDFSWEENGKKLKLSTLDDGKKYLLIFWSTQCSHCVKEIPEIYEFMKDKKDVSVIAFAIEENDLDFNSWKNNRLYKWHNVLGMNPKGGNKFENKTVRDYLIDSTPTYFVLDENKKIIATPYIAKDVKDYFKEKTTNKKTKKK